MPIGVVSFWHDMSCWLQHNAKQEAQLLLTGTNKSKARISTVVPFDKPNQRFVLCVNNVSQFNCGVEETVFRCQHMLHAQTWLIQIAPKIHINPVILISIQILATGVLMEQYLSSNSERYKN